MSALPRIRKTAPTKQPSNDGMPKIRPLVAGIDVGSEKHFVCAPTNEGGTEARVFGTTTADLRAILEWLQEAHVESLALESTGVYWIPLYETAGQPRQRDDTYRYAAIQPCD